ncbi:MAG: Na(+)-translocating NADH-quinone reductase subunit A [Planctomycetaceae bacterium]|nr:Na(+)-translocating NADH-quinone reductase subunit A [Planctomycetaceae bacterium]
MHRINKGLNLPIKGEPVQEIVAGPDVKQVAVVGFDYVGMKPTMEVQVGDKVKAGQLLFTDKKTEGVRYTAPGSGEVIAVNRGQKRVFQSVVIQLDDQEEALEFTNYSDKSFDELTGDQVRELLVESGLWTSFRTRPFSKVPAIDAFPHSIFVTAIDTNPLAVNPEIVIRESGKDFEYGLQIIRHLTSGKVHLCKAPGVILTGGDLPSVEVHEFEGPHPAGLPGTHIHMIDPVGLKKSVWHINYQDVIAIARLFLTGKLDFERVVSLAGPRVKSPKVIRTRIGASLDDLTAGELDGDHNRIISGSVFSGRNGVAPFNFLGRYHLQISVIEEGTEREFLGWQKPGFDKFSVKKIFASAFNGKADKFDFTTSTQGSKRAMVPIGSYEQVMPLDIIPTFLLRSLIVEDTEQSQALGCLELDEEDLALCTFVCPGKYEYGPILRKNLTRIEKEG